MVFMTGMKVISNNNQDIWFTGINPDYPVLKDFDTENKNYLLKDAIKIINNNDTKTIQTFK